MKIEDIFRRKFPRQYSVQRLFKPSLPLFSLEIIIYSIVYDDASIEIRSVFVRSEIINVDVGTEHRNIGTTGHTFFVVFLLLSCYLFTVNKVSQRDIAKT